MQKGGNPNDQGMPPPYQTFTPYTAEQLQQWQQYGIPQQQFTPEIVQYMQQQGMPQQQVTPEMMAQWQAQLYQMQMQQMQQIQQMQGMPEELLAQQKRKRRQANRRSGGGGFRRFLILLLVIAILGGGAWFVLRGTRGSAPTTAVIEMGTLGTTYRGDALIVRSEVAYSDEGVQSIEFIAQEGGTVYRRDVICNVYSTGYTTRDIDLLQSYRDQIKNYQRTLLKGEVITSEAQVDRLKNTLIERGLEVRSLVQGARGNLINQEKILDIAITQWQNFFRSKYSSDMRLNRLYDEENTQQKRIQSGIKQHIAQEERLVSFYTDGFEHVLTKGSYDSFTPSEVRAMINGQKPEESSALRGRTNIYRLVEKSDYAVLMLVRDNTWNPVEGSTHKLMLEHFSNTVVTARIMSFTRSGGELLLRLAVMGDVTPVLYMRSCSAELGEYADCMSVPSSAIIQQNGSDGVVIITEEGRQLFVPVNVVAVDGGKSYIAAIQTGVLSVGQTVRLFR